jgi:nucleotidyltransferase substrate binding protein (TIGR01987 family)
MVLEEEGYSLASPRETIKLAFQSGPIVDGHLWMEALKDRNLTVHTCEEKIAIAVEKKIRDFYFPVLEKLFHDFSEKADQ